MPESASNQHTLRLEVVAGPAMRTVTVEPGVSVILGRSSQCDWQLPDNTVSRKHAMITRRHGQWLVTDLESRHGTFLNGVRLEPNNAAPVNPGDLLRLGPWTFRVRVGESMSSGLRTDDDYYSTNNRVQRVPQTELRSIAQQRLELLIECAASINASSDDSALADSVLDAVIRGTGFPRAALIRLLGAEDDAAVELVGFHGPEHEEASDLVLSRSLVEAAAKGEIVRLSGDAPINYGESIARLGIHSALCAPIMIDNAIAAYLYLDARNKESSVQHDAAAFCQAIARMCGLAMSNIKRTELKNRHDRLVSDVREAGRAQAQLMPPTESTLAGFRYRVEMRVGRMVSGDLFNVVPLPGDRLGVYLGDVAGKGPSASILQTVVHTRMETALEKHADPAEACNEVNQRICARIDEGRFISLWCGVFDAAEGVVRFVDAGHGHWLVRRNGQRAHTHPCVGGIPLGIDASMHYATESLPIVQGDRLIVFSDGVVEQQSPAGEEFGLERVVDLLAATDTPDDEVSALIRAVLDFAAHDTLADDVTVASIECLAAP